MDLKQINAILTEPWEYFVVLIDVDVARMGVMDPSTIAVKRKIEYNIISKYQLHKTPIWIIVLAVLGGILLLTAISYGMYRVSWNYISSLLDFNLP
mgnify:CR=1 FL=1